MDSKCNHMYPFKREAERVLRERRQCDHTGRDWSCVVTRHKCLEPPETRKGNEQIPSRTFREGVTLCTPGFWTTGLQTVVICYSSRRKLIQWAKIKMSARLFVLKDLGENLLPCLFQLLATCIPWLVPASRWPLLPSLHFLWPTCFPLIRTIVYIRPTWIIQVIFPTQNPSFNYICKAPFAI